VIFQGRKLKMEKSDDGKSVEIKGLVAAGLTLVAKTQELDLVMASSKVTIKLEVVNSKIETVTK
jgi:hypothetical protein